MLQFFAGGFVNVILHFANEHLAKVYGSWNEANFGAMTWRELSVIGPILVVMMLVSQISGKPLNALLLGDAYARTLGVSVERIRLALLANIVVTAGLITAYCGPVSFIDLVVPHVCRMMFRTSDHCLLLPGVLLLGAVLGTAGDLLVNLPWQDHFLHLNAVLALIGAPVAAWMVARNRSQD
jgi:iron complex transport system permease protein